MLVYLMQEMSDKNEEMSYNLNILCNTLLQTIKIFLFIWRSFSLKQLTNINTTIYSFVSFNAKK